jgi:hypothetical protein
MQLPDEQQLPGGEGELEKIKVISGTDNKGAGYQEAGDYEEVVRRQGCSGSEEGSRAQ